MSGEIVRPGEGSPREIALFSNDEFRLEITPHDVDGFHVQAPGVARQLGFREAHDLLRNIPEAERGSELFRTPNGGQPATVSYLTEAGFYRALGQRQASRISDPTARAFVERFQSWVFGEVLPKLRRGELVAVAPVTPAIPQTLPEALRLAPDLAEDRGRVAGKVAALAPAAESWNTLATAEGDFLVADAAKILSRDPHIKIGQNRLFTKLGELGWIYRAPGDQKWRTKQSAIEKSRISEIPMTHYHPRAGALILDPPQVRVTVKGLEWLHQHLRSERGAA